MGFVRSSSGKTRRLTRVTATSASVDAKTVPVGCKIIIVSKVAFKTSRKHGFTRRLLGLKLFVENMGSSQHGLFAQLVEKNASVDASDYDKRSAMHLACAEGHVNVVRIHLTECIY